MLPRAGHNVSGVELQHSGFDSTASSTTPFDAVAGRYDDVFSNTLIGFAQRRSVWIEMDRAFHTGHRILEINCGTGIDALHLANRGVSVVACDSSPRMVAEARRRIDASPKRAAVELRCIPTEQIAQLEIDGPFDGVLSNFAGLNCVADLEQVAGDLARLVRPGGRAVMCLFGRVCLWEIVWYLVHGNTTKAFRRFSRNGVTARLAPDSTVTVHYRSVRSLRRAFSSNFRLENRIGVGIAIPPSYAASLPVRFPRLFDLAVAIDPWLGFWPGSRALADHIVLTFTRSS